MAFATGNWAGTAGTELSVIDSNFSKVSGISANALVDGSGGVYDQFGNPNFYQHSATPPSADYYVEADIPGNGTGTYSASVAARIVGQTMYVGFWHGGVNAWVIQRYDDINTSTYIYNGGSTTNSPTVQRRIKIECIGSTINFYSDGVLAATATDSTYTAAGKAGVGPTNPSTSWIKNWSASAFGPSISSQPADQTVNEGATIGAFSVTATGSGTLTYQWQDNSTGSFADISGATSSTYTPSIAADPQYSGRQYRVNVTDTVGTTTSSAATLSIPSVILVAKVYNGSAWVQVPAKAYVSSAWQFIQNFGRETGTWY